MSNNEDEARFWKQKYLEQLLNHTQIVTALMRPMLAENAAASAALREAAESAPTGQLAVKNGASKTVAKQ
jgi:hypothetical protein